MESVSLWGGQIIARVSQTGSSDSRRKGKLVLARAAPHRVTDECVAATEFFISFVPIPQDRFCARFHVRGLNGYRD
jgi:hypothetical protein